MSVQLIPKTNQKRKRFTPQEKLKILKEWEATGNGVIVAEKYDIHPHTLYRWKKALEQGAETFLSGKRPKTSSRVRELEEENRRLKDALVLQTQELMQFKKKWNLV